MQSSEGSQKEEVFKELGRLESETEALNEEIQKCDHKDDAVVGFFEIVGKILGRVFNL
ncbi:MAG: hypothetical protein AB7G93_13415 [Bdellovibrionales bacterium]